MYLHGCIQGLICKSTLYKYNFKCYLVIFGDFLSIFTSWFIQGSTKCQFLFYQYGLLVDKMFRLACPGLLFQRKWCCLLSFSRGWKGFMNKFYLPVGKDPSLNVCQLSKPSSVVASTFSSYTWHNMFISRKKGNLHEKSIHKYMWSVPYFQYNRPTLVDICFLLAQTPYCLHALSYHKMPAPTLSSDLIRTSPFFIPSFNSLHTPCW